MSDTDDARLSPHPTAIGTLTRLAYARAEAAGIDVGRMMKRAHLTLLQILDPSKRLRVRDQISFVNQAANELKDDLLGFHLARLPDLREIGWLYYVAASSETLSEALRRAARYCSITNEGISMDYADDRVISVAIHYVGVSRHVDRHQIEFITTILVRLCRHLSGRQIVPARVRFVHRHKNVTSAFIDFLGGNIEFGAMVDEVAFPAALKKSRAVGADPYLNKLLINYCEEALAYRKNYCGSFRSSVENAIVPLLPHGKPHAGDIARRLGMSRRTFARRLSVERLSFSEVLESLRFDLAKRHIADSDLSISDIAWLLGYQEVSAFTHAFKRWTGRTPREARAAHCRGRRAELT